MDRKISPHRLQSKEPDFPRPSSAIARGKLHNRRLLNHQKQLILSKKNAPPPPHAIDFDDNDGDFQPSVGFPSSINEPSIWMECGDSNLNQELMNTMKSQIIKSHSLMVPGIESLYLSHHTQSHLQSIDSNASQTTSHYLQLISDDNNDQFHSSHNSIEDAIRLIMTGAQEFCYLEANDPTNPYQLTLTTMPTNPSNPKYITLSRQWIIRHGAGESDQITLKEFLKEYYVYHQIIKIPLFRQYSEWKTFKKWSLYTLTQRRRKNLKNLQPSLALLDDNLRNILMFAQYTCASLYQRESTKLGVHLLNDITRLLDVQKRAAMKLDSENSSVVPIERPVDRHQHHSDITIPSGVQTSNMYSKMFLFQQLTTLIRNEGEKRGIRILTQMPTVLTTSSYFHFMQSHDLHAAIDKDLQNQSRSMEHTMSSSIASNTVYRPQMPLSYTERANIRLSCRQIANTVRVVDYMIRDTLYQTVESGLNVFLNKLLKLRQKEILNGHIHLSVTIESSFPDHPYDLSHLPPPSSSLFSPSLTHSPTAILMVDPNKEAVMEGLKATMEEALNTGCHDNLILHREELKILFKAIQNEIQEISIDDLVYSISKNSLQTIIEECTEIIETDINHSLEIIQSYHYLCLLYVSTYQLAHQLTVDYLIDKSTTEIHENLMMIQRNIHELSQLPAHVDEGVIRIDIHLARDYVMNMLRVCQQKYHHFIPKMFVIIGERIYNVAHEIKIALQKQIKTVDDYVKAIEIFNQAYIGQNELNEKHQYHTSLMEIMSDHSIPMTDEIFGLTATLKTEYQMYLDAMSTFEDEKENYTKNYQRELIQRVKNIQSPINDIALRLVSDLLSSPESDPIVALDEIKELEQLFLNVNKTGRNILHCQSVMDIYVFDSTSLAQIQDHLVILRCVWENVLTIQELFASYVEDKTTNGVSFLRINLMNFKKVYQTSSKKLEKLSRHEFANVEVWLHEQLEILSKVTPLLEYLQSKILTPLHKSAIEKLLGMNIYQLSSSSSEISDSSTSTIITVHDLLEKCCILKYSLQIEDIYHRSICENNLLLQYHELQNLLSTFPLYTQSHSSSKSLILISNLAEAMDFLDELILTISSSLQSQFIQFIQHEYSEFLDKIMAWKQMLKHISLIQKDMLRLRVLFTNPRTTRYIHSALRYFNVIDDTWRVIIKTSKQENNLLFLLMKSGLEHLVEAARDAVTQVDDIVNKFITEQREKYPKFYLLTFSEVCYIHTVSDMNLVFESCSTVLFPYLTGLDLVSTSESSHVNIQINGTYSHHETLTFLSSCPIRGTIADWFKSLEISMSERLMSDTMSLVTESKQIMEDIRSLGSCNQARILSIQVKFWQDIYRIYDPENSSVRKKLVNTAILDIQDKITTLSTLFSITKSSIHHTLAISNMILCYLQFKDILVQLVTEVSGSTSGGDDTNYFPFYLQYCSLHKLLQPNTNQIIIKCGLIERCYGNTYHGFYQRMVVTPLTEKCYLAMTHSFASATNHTIPLIRGSHGDQKIDFIREVTYEYGQDLYIVNCQFEGKSMNRLELFIHAAMKGKFHLCFDQIETLQIEILSKLLQTLSSLQLKSTNINSNVTNQSQPGKPSAISRANTWAQSTLNNGSNISSLPSPSLNFQKPYFSLCMNLSHCKEMFYFPAILRKKFRPIHLQLPSLQIILRHYLESFGFLNPLRSSYQLTSFIEHLRVHCHHLRKSLLFHVLIKESLPKVSSEIFSLFNHNRNLESPQQCYLILKDLFKRLPQYFHTNLDLENIQYSCNLFLSMSFDPIQNSNDFKGQPTTSPMNMMTNILKTRMSSVIVIGEAGCGKTTLIRSSLGSLFGYRSLSSKKYSDNAEEEKLMTHGMEINEDPSDRQSQGEENHHENPSTIPNKVYEYIVNPMLIDHANSSLSMTDSPSLSTCSRDHLPHDDEDHLKTGIEKLLINIMEDPSIEYVHLDLPDSHSLAYYGSLLTHYHSPVNSSTTKLGIIWECCEIVNLDPSFVVTVPLVVIQESLFTEKETLNLLVEDFCVKFDHKSRPTPLRSSLLFCVDKIILPLIPSSLTGDDTNLIYKRNHSLLRSLFSVAESIFSALGFCCNCLDHLACPSHLTTTSNSLPSEKIFSRWHTPTFFRIWFFACIWTFGVSSPSVKYQFETLFEKLYETYEQYQIALEKQNNLTTATLNRSTLNNYNPDFMESFPKTCEPYSYVLEKFDEESVVATWVHWSYVKNIEFSPAISSNSLRARNQTYCTSYEIEMCRFVAPTNASVSINFIQDCLLTSISNSFESTSTGSDDRTSTPNLQTTPTHTLISPSPSITTVMLFGESGVGKTSLLSKLMQQSKKWKRWTCVLSDTSFPNIIRGIELAKEISFTYFAENFLPMNGFVFIDDVNISSPTTASYLSTTGTLNHPSQSAAEFIRSIHDNNYYYDSNKSTWTHQKQLYSILSSQVLEHSSSPSNFTTSSILSSHCNLRLLKNCLLFSLFNEENVLIQIFSQKLHLMCPYIKEDLASDLSLLSMKLFESYRGSLEIDHDHLLTPLIKTISPPWSTSTLFENLQIYLQDFSVVSSTEIGKSWKRILNLQYSGSNFQSRFHGCLEKLLGELSFQTSNLKSILVQSYGAIRRNESPRFATSVVLRRMTALKTMNGHHALIGKGDRPLLPNSPKKLLAATPPDDAMEAPALESPRNNIFVGFMTIEELRDSYVKSMCNNAAMQLNDADLLDVELVDTGNAELWRDVQKSCVFLKTTGRFALIFGSVLPIIKSTLKISCSICQFLYRPHLLDPDLNLQDLSHKIVMDFSKYLLYHSELNTSSSVNTASSFAPPATGIDTAPENSNFINLNRKHHKTTTESSPHQSSTPASTTSRLYTDNILWHLHLEENNSNITSQIWFEIQKVFHLSNLYSQQLLHHQFGLNPQRDNHLRQHLLSYISKVKLIISFGPYSNVKLSLIELSEIPLFSVRFQYIHLSSLYGVNLDILSDFFPSDSADLISSSIVEVVTLIRDSDFFENSSYYQQIQSPEYTQGTYDMIIKLFYLSCGESTHSTFMIHFKNFLKMVQLFSSESSTSSFSDSLKVDAVPWGGNIDEDEDEEQDTIGQFPSASVHKISPEILKRHLSEIIYAVMVTRYGTHCPFHQRQDFEHSLKQIMSETKVVFLSEMNDMRGMVYATYHTLTNKLDESTDSLSRFIDCMIICSPDIPSIQYEYCSMILGIMLEKSLRIGGKAHFVGHLFALLTGLKARQAKVELDKHQQQPHDGRENDFEYSKLLCMKSLSLHSSSELFFQMETVLHSKSILSSQQQPQSHIFDLVNPSTTILHFDSLSQVTTDTIIFTYLLNGGSADKSLYESWKTLYNNIQRVRGGSSSLSNFQTILSSLSNDLFIFHAACRLILLQWKFVTQDLLMISKCIISFMNSTYHLPKEMYETLPDTLSRVIHDTILSKKETSLKSILNDVLNFCYISVIRQLNDTDVYSMKLMMVLQIQRDCNCHENNRPHDEEDEGEEEDEWERKRGDVIHTCSNSEYSWRTIYELFYCIKTYLGSLGLLMSRELDSGASLPTSTVDFLMTTFSYLKYLSSSRSRPSSSIGVSRNSGPGTNGLTMITSDKIIEYLHKYNLEFANWANIYTHQPFLAAPNQTNDRNASLLPLPQDAIDRLGWIERLLIIIAIKPLAIDQFLDIAILSLGEWNFPSREMIDGSYFADTSKQLKHLSTMEINYTKSVVIYHNHFGASDTRYQLQIAEMSKPVKECGSVPIIFCWPTIGVFDPKMHSSTDQTFGDQHLVDGSVHDTSEVLLPGGALDHESMATALALGTPAATTVTERASISRKGSSLIGFLSTQSSLIFTQQQQQEIDIFLKYFHAIILRSDNRIYQPEKDFLPLLLDCEEECAIESNRLLYLSYSDELVEKGTVITRPPAESYLMTNFLGLLKHNFLLLICYHEEYISCYSPVNRSHISENDGDGALQFLTPTLSRLYWLLAFFHTSVILRVDIRYTSLGDDTLWHGVASILTYHLSHQTLSCSSSKASSTSCFANTRGPNLEYEQFQYFVQFHFCNLYSILVDDPLDKSMIFSLYQNYFPLDCLNPHEEYYMLGILILPSSFNKVMIEQFVDKIKHVMSASTSRSTSGDTSQEFHLIDFLGCTSGEYSETFLKTLVENEKNSYFLPSIGKSTIRMNSSIPSSLSSSTSILNADMTRRLRVCIQKILKLLPVKIDLSSRGVSSILAKAPSLQPQSPIESQPKRTTLRKRNKTGVNLGKKIPHTEDKLWKFLLLEINCFNSSIQCLHEQLEPILSATSPQQQSQLLPHLLSLENNLVPFSWLKIFTSHHDNVSVPLDLWLNQLRERRQMLGTWYTIKHCDVMKLHLLQNPLNLFHVLKEAVSIKLQIPLENVNLECRILDLPHNPIDRSAFFTKISTQNSSCAVNTYTIIASQVMIMNAIWAKDKYSLEFMHPATTSRRSQVSPQTFLNLLTSSIGGVPEHHSYHGRYKELGRFPMSALCHL